jgi:hypothetical protein
MTARTCDTAGCVAPHKARGLCQKHYNATPEHKSAIARWAATVAGKASLAAATARYMATDKGRASHAAIDARYKVTGRGKALHAAYHARYRASDKGKAAILESAWASGALRRATKAGAAVGDVPPDTRAILRERFGETCLADGCDNPATDVDHVIALANDGVHDISNFQTLCGSCNSAKGKSGTDYRPKEATL